MNFVIVGLRGVVQGGHAGDQLRDDHHAQRVDQQKPEQDGERHGQGVDQALHLFRDEPAQKRLNGVAHRLEQIGDDGTVDKGHQDACQGGDGVPKAVKAVNKEKEDDTQCRWHQTLRASHRDTV